MTTQTEAIKLALEALEEINKLSIGENAICLPAEIDAAMDALLEALAEQPAQQEPVAVVSGYYGGQCVILPTNPARIFNSNTALYTSPQPPAQPLTDEVIAALWSWSQSAQAESIANTQQHAFARAIEAAHGITKGNT